MKLLERADKHASKIIIYYYNFNCRPIR
jgi:hypothetical protein